MKTIMIWLEDEDFELVRRAKGSQTWRRFILDAAKVKVQASQASAGPTSTTAERQRGVEV